MVTPVKSFNYLVPKDQGAERVTFGCTYGDHERHCLDVWLPAERDGRPLPIAVYFYGGAWAMGDKHDYEWLGRALATRGIATVLPNYRLFPEVRYPEFLEDCADAVAWVQEHAADFGGDADSIVLVGNSAGAYNAAMLALQRRWLEQAGVGRDRIAGWVGLAGPYDFLPLIADATKRTFGHHDDLRETQPINAAGPDSPPAFLATGTMDVLVWPRNTRVLAERLHSAGVAVEHRRYAGLGHTTLVAAMAKPFRSWGPVLEEVAGFVHARAARRPIAARTGPLRPRRSVLSAPWIRRAARRA